MRRRFGDNRGYLSYVRFGFVALIIVFCVGLLFGAILGMGVCT